MAGYDMAVFAETRFSGGSAAAVIADISAMSAAGATVALVPVTSRFFDGAPDVPNSAVLALADLGGVSLQTAPQQITARAAFFHQPQPIYAGVAERIALRAERAVIVAHHPPFRGDGSLEYDPLRTVRLIDASFGVRPWCAPVSGVVRQQLRSCAPRIRLSSEVWVNRVDPENWQPGPPAFSNQTAIVGRHGRADPLKWPDRARDIEAPLDPGPGWQARVLGCPEAELRARGAEPSAWDCVPFGSVPVQEYLQGLDVFSYFYSDRWAEAFGRTVLEAMLMERPCVLDPRLEPTFGPHARFCKPQEAPALIRRLRETPEATQSQCRDVRERVAKSFASAEVPRQFERLLKDPGSRSRTGPKSASPLVALRKTGGLALRRAKMT